MGRVASVKKRQATLNKHRLAIGAAELQRARLETTVGEQTLKVSRLERSKGRLNEEVTGLKVEVTALQTKLTALQTQVQSKQTALQTAIQANTDLGRVMTDLKSQIELSRTIVRMLKEAQTSVESRVQKAKEELQASEQCKHLFNLSVERGSEPLVDLNIGGTLFTIEREALLRFPYLEHLVHFHEHNGGDGPAPVAIDPDVFTLLLKWLRYAPGSKCLKEGSATLMALSDAELEQLVNICEYGTGSPLESVFETESRRRRVEQELQHREELVDEQVYKNIETIAIDLADQYDVVREHREKYEASHEEAFTYLIYVSTLRLYDDQINNVKDRYFQDRTFLPIYYKYIFDSANSRFPKLRKLFGIAFQLKTQLLAEERELAKIAQQYDVATKTEQYVVKKGVR